MTERPFIHPNGECAQLKRILGKNLPYRSQLEEFRPLPQMYLRPDAIDGLHGDGHSARVTIHDQLLSRLLALRGIEVDPLTVGYFSKTHDLRRADDNHDPFHGKRAADYVAAYGGVVPTILVPAVSYLNEWHVPDDGLAPGMTYELAVAKDSDALDRVREKGALNPDFLRFPESRELLIRPAVLLYNMSTHIQDEYHLSPYDSVIQAAIEMDLVFDR